MVHQLLKERGSGLIEVHLLLKKMVSELIEVLKDMVSKLTGIHLLIKKMMSGGIEVHLLPVKIMVSELTKFHQLLKRIMFDLVSVHILLKEMVSELIDLSSSRKWESTIRILLLSALPVHRRKKDSCYV